MPGAALGAASLSSSKAPPAAMFYVAYFRKGLGNRPITFLFTSGPGPSSVWLHMGAFGSKREITADDRRIPAAPYKLVDNAYSLPDSSDLVFTTRPAPASAASRARTRPISPPAASTRASPARRWTP